VRALVACAIGVVVVDLDDEELVIEEEPADALPATGDTGVSLPLLLASVRHGSTVIALVDRRPPLLVSSDSGTSWHEAGAGLPPGRAVAISDDDPDLILFAGEERLFLSRDGGRFWQALTIELPGITGVAFEDA
jgi:hypothetical protein